MKKKLLLLIPCLFLIQIAKAEIIDQRTEQTCNGNNCIWEQYESNRFPIFNNELMYFSDFASGYIQNNVIHFDYLDGTQVQLIPILHYRNNLYYLNETSPVVPDSNITMLRDYFKFQSHFVKTNQVHGIGFIVEANRDIDYLEQENETALLIGNVSLSYNDLIQAGFPAEFYRQNNTIWIPLDDYPNGAIWLDPVTTIWSEANDGACFINGTPTCISCSGTSTTYYLTTGVDPTGHGYYQYAFNSFNTSSIPDDATIISANHTQYATAYFESGTPFRPNYVYTFSSKQNYADPLDCTAYSHVFPTYEGLTDWGTSVGYKTEATKNTSINVTGFTSFRMILVSSGLSAGDVHIFTIVASENTGVKFDPSLKIEYSIPTPLESEVGFIIPYLAKYPYIVANLTNQTNLIPNQNENIIILQIDSNETQIIPNNRCPYIQLNRSLDLR